MLIFIETLQVSACLFSPQISRSNSDYGCPTASIKVIMIYYKQPLPLCHDSVFITEQSLVAFLLTSFLFTLQITTSASLPFGHILLIEERKCN